MLKERIKQMAVDAGIDVVGFTPADPFDGYLWPQSPRRDPRLSLTGARSLIVFGIYIGGFTIREWANPAVGRTSRLFLSGYFSDVVNPLRPIASYLKDEGFSAMICDSLTPGGSILPLKLTAVRAGLGWQGKHTLVISPKYGTFLAWGGIVTDAPLEPEGKSIKDRCEKCRNCQEACPTGALEQAYRLNLDRCLSYLLQGESLPGWAKEGMANRIIDCEICQEVCPFNTRHIRRPLGTERTLRFRESAVEITERFRFSNLLKLSDAEIEAFLRSYYTSYTNRIFRRNIMAAHVHSNTRRLWK